MATGFMDVCFGGLLLESSVGSAGINGSRRLAIYHLDCLKITRIWGLGRRQPVQ